MPHGLGLLSYSQPQPCYRPLAESFLLFDAVESNPTLARQVRVSWGLGWMGESRYEEATVQAKASVIIRRTQRQFLFAAYMHEGG